MKLLTGLHAPNWFPDRDAVRGFFSGNSLLYRWMYPSYQDALLRSLAHLWVDHAGNVLDVGSGNGLVAAFIKRYFPVKKVFSIDVVDRVLPGAEIDFCVYDGVKIPFDNESVDGVVLVNVLHHVALQDRRKLVKEMLRVCKVGGFVLIKDHIESGFVDRLRLHVMDMIGNVPFSGMVSASYLSAEDWNNLLSGEGVYVSMLCDVAYRKGFYAWLFPNRLEVVFRVEKNTGW